MADSRFDSRAAAGDNQTVNTWQEIEQLGFYPTLVERALRRAAGGTEPVASVTQLDAAFDSTSMFRHLTVTALTRTHLVQVHVDELEEGGAMVSTTIAPIGAIRGLTVMEAVTDPSASDGGGTPTEVSFTLNLGGQRRGEVEPLHCEDPECPADHGYSQTTYPDDLSVRISDAADGAEAVVAAVRFVDALTQAIGQANG